MAFPDLRLSGTADPLMEGTFCFVDMAGFTALTEAHGDEAAARLAVRLSELVQSALSDQGRIVKSIGDAILDRMDDHWGDDPDRPPRRLKR